MMNGVRTPDPPLPDLDNPQVRKQEFETLNQNVWYTEENYEFFKYLESQLYQELALDPQLQYWNLSLNYIKDLITKVQTVLID
jgi:hypothetical protein